MSTSKFNAASRAANLAAKSAALNFKETKVPDNSVDFVTSFKANSSATIKMSNIFTVDVLPNFVPIIMFIMFHCVQSVSRLDDRSHAKVTLPTYIMYCLVLTYGHILLNDMHIRPSSSAYAQDYFRSPEKKQFADLLLTLPVPAFLEPLLSSLTCTTAPQTGNVVFCPSAAGFAHSIHFGRLFPINIFSSIHDYVAEINSRAPPNKVISSLWSIAIFSVVPSVYKIGNFFGAAASTTVSNTTPANREYSSYQSILRQSFDSAFNPVLSRDYTRRSSLAPLNIISPVFTNDRFNPYDMLFAFSPSNFAELRIVLQSVASVLNGSIPCSSDLAKIIGTNSGKDILLHGYSTFALPTWHSIQIPSHYTNLLPEDFTIEPREHRIPPEDYATLLHFLPEPTQTAAEHTNTFVPATATCDVNHSHPVTINPMTPALNLLIPTAITNPPICVPAPSEFVHFDETRDTAPLLLVLEPIESNVESAWKASAFGMIIESFEIDASVVPMPNAEVPLALQNARFIESSIPTSAIDPATSFDLVTYHYARSRFIESRNNFRAATLLVDFSKVSIPRPILNTLDALIHAGFPGLTLLNNVTWIQRATSFLGMKLNSTRVPNHPESTYPHVASHQLLLWSPYTYTPVPSDFNNLASRLGYNTAPHTVYLISNLRTLFGSDPQLIEMTHAFNAMPIA